jgi:uncharacterized protein (DUF2252 family)
MTMNENLTDPPKAKTRPIMVIRALRAWNEELEVEDRQNKYCRMASAPLVFYRGTNHLFWADFAGDERLQLFGNARTKSWIQGDLHVYNYGSYGNAEGEVVYDLNDFDETIYADYQYDLWRMAVSLMLVAWQNDDLSASQLEKMVDAFSQTYLDTLTSYRKKKNDPSGIYFPRDKTYSKLNRFLKSVEDQYTRKGMLKKWAPMDKNGRRRFDVDGRPNKLGKASDGERARIREEMANYRNTLNNDPAKDDAYFEVKDIARRLAAGTGSLGTRRFYVLIEAGPSGNPDDDRILDVKRQGKPTPYHFLGKKARREYDKQFEKNHARRQVVGYRDLTCLTDAHLGWMHLEDGTYSVRERSPFKEAFPGEALDSRTAFSELAEQWAEILATDHARANKDLPGLVNTLIDDQDQVFLNLVREIAFSYADQVRDDWRHFVTALELQPGQCEQLPFAPPSYRDTLPR